MYSPLCSTVGCDRYLGTLGSLNILGVCFTLNIHFTIFSKGKVNDGQLGFLKRNT